MILQIHFLDFILKFVEQDLTECTFASFAGKFENGVAEGTVDPSLNPISSFRLSVIQNSAVWAILNEVRGGRTFKNITGEWEISSFCFEAQTFG